MSLPIYCLAFNPRRHQLVCGLNAGIRLYALDEAKECGHYVKSAVLFIAKEHTDIVSCIICLDARIYSAGFDQKLVIYDYSYAGNNKLVPVFNNQVHDAGITSLLMAKDIENTWIVTGSYDKTVKIWTAEGKLIHKLDNFPSSVTGVCYIPRNKTLWVASGASYAWLYDPKSGDNVSDFIGTFQNVEEEKYQLQILRFYPEHNFAFATTNRRQMVIWKYKVQACVTALKTRTSLECICFTAQEPILIFTGDHEGITTKWERMQSNPFLYSKETLQVSDNKKRKRVGTRPLEEFENNNAPTVFMNVGKNKRSQSQYAFDQKDIPTVAAYKHANVTIMQMLYIENLDCLLTASEDSNIYLWGLDDSAVQALEQMNPDDVDTLVEKYGILLDPSSVLLPQNAQPKAKNFVSKRVAGLLCKCVFAEHISCVSALLLVGRDQGQESTYVLSGGWDQRICLWDIEKYELKAVFENVNEGKENNQLACDGIITDMAYNPKTNEFAYSSSDKMVYIRKFDTRGSHMVLTNTLQGHEGEVNCVAWNDICSKWVTASEDGTVRIWGGSLMNLCEQVLNLNSAITALCIDCKVGCIIVGVQKEIKVYEAQTYQLVQTNKGHTDSVRSIIHIPERDQYVSCSWDKTIRIWNSYKQPRWKKSKATRQTKHSLKLPKDMSIESEGQSSFNEETSEETMSKSIDLPPVSLDVMEEE
ncbi:hypothetical protein C0Q70_20589 [Pomacea canaliculata]|uniref:WD repeat-containing protein 55 homolog n=2 Tax=Pomacea canaliculata TaxID=400727 RepID=A0A2T7NG08_POMCA|nr:hypothetical protein C0Q70_20589 [Pomacea canaliculata]